MIPHSYKYNPKMLKLCLLYRVSVVFSAIEFFKVEIILVSYLIMQVLPEEPAPKINRISACIVFLNLIHGPDLLILKEAGNRVM